MTPEPQGGAARTLLSAARLSPRACSLARTSRHLPGHLEPARQSQKALFLRVGKPGIAWNQTQKSPQFLPGLKAASEDKAASVNAAWGGDHLVPPRGTLGLPSPLHTSLKPQSRVGLRGG